MNEYEQPTNLSPEEQEVLNGMLANLRENEAAARPDSIPWLALLGAAIGAVPGILAWFGIGMLGYTWSMVGAVIVIGVFFLYDKFGGETDNQYGIIGCILICLLAVYLGVHLSWAGQFHQVLREEGDISFGECFLRVYEFVDYLEIKGEFIFAVLKGYLFAGLGAFGMIARALKGIR